MIAQGDIGVIVDGPEIGVTKYQLRQALANIIIADITAYLADIDSNAAIPAVVLTDRKLRAMAWFGIFGYADSEEENAALDDPEMPGPPNSRHRNNEAGCGELENRP